MPTRIFIILFVTVFFYPGLAHCQDAKEPTFVPPYYLAVLKGWHTEHFPMPPGFASQITYKGMEDLRFAPGWSDSTGEHYWSYAYLWWIEGTPSINTDSLKKNLIDYYNGLIGANLAEKNVPASKILPAAVTIQQAKTGEGDKQTFKGEIRMTDYMTQKPIVLNALIHIRNCTNQKHTAVFAELSPKPFTHPVWQDFSEMLQEFECEVSLVK